MKITYQQIQDRRYTQALGKLATFGGFTDYKQVANIKTFLKQFEKIAAKSQKEWIELLKCFSVLDEKGDFVPKKILDTTTGQTMTQPGSFTITPGKEDEAQMKMAEFNAKTAEIWADPIHFETVQGCGLSANDLIQLEDIIIEPELQTTTPALEAVK